MFKSFVVRLNISSNFFRQSSTATSEILFNKINNIGVITLNRPKQLNALNYNITSQFNTKLKEFNNDDEVKAILVKSSSNTAFCAGGDINQTNDCYDKAHIHWKSEYTLPYRISLLKKPYISLLNGFTLGMGAGICVHGQYRIATDRTVFAMPETALGYFPDGGFFKFAASLEDDISLFMGLTGARIKGKDVRLLGIATHFMNETDLNKFESELIESRNIDIDLKDLLKKYDQKCEGKYETDQIHKYFNETSISRILSNLEADNSEWSKKQLDLLKKMCPTSLLITIRQRAIEQKLTLKEAVEFEYKLGHSLFKNNRHDFNEGVNSVLKRIKPRWNPASIKNLTNKDIDAYFDRLNEYEADFSLD